MYNEVLAGQVEALERRLQETLFHPRYRPVVVFAFGRTKAINGPDKAREVDDDIAVIENCIKQMEKVKTADDVRAAMSSYLPSS